MKKSKPSSKLEMPFGKFAQNFNEFLMNPKIDNYLENGCGRCPLGGTPQCKVHNWQPELAKLRAIVLDCGLTEELKWGVPTYTFQQSNIAIVSAFKDYCSLSFFKGSLLQDTDNVLEKPGEDSQAARLFRFTNIQKIAELEDVIKAYVFEAIEVEKAGLKVSFKKIEEREIPQELQLKFEQIPELKTAFRALTPSRQRGYLLHFSTPKQAKTRVTRIEKCLPRIFEGKGLNDYS